MTTRYYLNPKQESKVKSIQEMLCLNSPSDVVTILISLYADDFIFKMSHFNYPLTSNEEFSQADLNLVQQDKGLDLVQCELVN